ncbi:hypothetical protein DQ238_21925 [Geodermatophilus sp. TF02-6]|uniref:hypothetical protein n=1 Tax=Geodermatophilus sp. TF02-6 TaxID=2250575 RepID=UPI000DEAC49F|nr:hypothetical protein [Geodermatophilus sp. TF02-6]RBY74435.1 hypothetical protein DQ238_21925 [Geodermatophilus sp. TF02-6]
MAEAAAAGRAVRSAAGVLGLPPAALAPALTDPMLRLLVGEGCAALLRRQWRDDGTAEAVVVHRRGLGAGSPAVLATAAGWGCDVVREGDDVRHDVAGGLVVLAAAGGVALTPDGEPLQLLPDTARLVRFVAAGTAETARELLRALA